MKNQVNIWLVFTGLICLFVFTGYDVSYSQQDAVSKVIFSVGWYDVGKDALAGLKGVKRVEKGFRNSKEINTVYYDPSVITVEEMETALKKAGTYMGTLE